MPASGELVLIVRGRFREEAATSAGQTFEVSVADSSDVDVVAPAVVSLGNPQPTGSALELYRFEVTGFSPLISPAVGGGEIVLTGSGFRAPVTIRIGPSEVEGTASVNAEATRIEGIQVPPGELGEHEITYMDPRKGQVTLAMTFRYGSISAGNSGCASNADASATWFALLMLLGLSLVLGRCRLRHAA